MVICNSQLTSIVLPDSVTGIEEYAFSYCSSLTIITFNGTIEQWNAVRKGYRWNFYTGTYTIHCSDGTITK